MTPLCLSGFHQYGVDQREAAQNRSLDNIIATNACQARDGLSWVTGASFFIVLTLQVVIRTPGLSPLIAS